MHVCLHQVSPELFPYMRPHLVGFAVQVQSSLQGELQGLMDDLCDAVAQAARSRVELLEHGVQERIQVVQPELSPYHFFAA